MYKYFRCQMGVKKFKVSNEWTNILAIEKE